MIALFRGGVSCTLDPELGGSLLSLCVHGVDLLRKASSKPNHVLEAACFPLVPFANRIRDGRMVFQGREVVLPADPAAPPHAHHGHGWRRPWRLLNRTDETAELEFRHIPDEWPWAYIANQQVTLIDGGAEIELSVTNLSDGDMPAGLGLHPYFVRHQADTIEMRAQRMLINGPDGIPTAEVPILSGEKQLAEFEAMDNFLLDESGQVSLRLGRMRCEMDARGAEGFHVYVPPGENFFCVEPVSHPPNAFATNAELYVLAPRATRRLHMRLSVVSADEETRG